MLAPTNVTVLANRLVKSLSSQKNWITTAQIERGTLNDSDPKTERISDITPTRRSEAETAPTETGIWQKGQTLASRSKKARQWPQNFPGGRA
jgi:hypothetical protein